MSRSRNRPAPEPVPQPAPLPPVDVTSGPEEEEASGVGVAEMAAPHHALEPVPEVESEPLPDVEVPPPPEIEVAAESSFTSDDGELESASEEAASPPSAPSAPPELAPAPPAPEVKRFRVTENCRYVCGGQINVWPIGLVIDDLNYDIDDVRKQGVPLAPATVEDIDTTPAIGHRAV